MTWKQKKGCLDILAAEEGWSRKAGGDLLSVCLAYPNIYRTGMSNLGFHAVYSLINCHATSLCERVFLPEPGDEEFDTDGARLISIESQRPLADFDIIAFSLSFENDYPNILQIMEMAGIPVETSARGENHPLVIGGGIAVTLNPEPLADFFDLFLIGEGEATLPDFLDRAADLMRGVPRDALLARIQKEVAGAYVPKFYGAITGKDGLIRTQEPLDLSFPARIVRPWAADLDSFATEQQIITEGTELGGMYLTEVSRGCGRGCRFCAAGSVCRPVRFRSAATLAHSFGRGINKRKTIGLLGTAVSDHPALPALCRSVLDQGGKVAIGSLRIDRISNDTLALLKETGVETVALAPEAGSQRLRNVIRKGITEEDIFSAVEKLMEYGIVRAKLYFMIGLPTETDEDAEAIIRLVREIQARAREASAGKKGFRSLFIGVNQFIPKAATPFQWHPLEDATVVRRRARKIRDGLRSEKGVRVTFDMPKWNLIQALLALGDRRTGGLLLAVHRLGGNWSRAFRETDMDIDHVYRGKGAADALPWDFIDHGILKTDLMEEYRKALSGTALPKTNLKSVLTSKEKKHDDHPDAA